MPSIFMMQSPVNEPPNPDKVDVVNATVPVDAALEYMLKFPLTVPLKTPAPLRVL